MSIYKKFPQIFIFKLFYLHFAKLLCVLITWLFFKKNYFFINYLPFFS